MMLHVSQQPHPANGTNTSHFETRSGKCLAMNFFPFSVSLSFKWMFAAKVIKNVDFANEIYFSGRSPSRIQKLFRHKK